MCRILAAEIEGPQGPILQVLFNSFILSSLYDPYLARLISTNEPSHGDGWGFASIGLVDGMPVIGHYKDMTPIYNDLSREIINNYISRLSRYRKIFLILHARRASLTEPLGREYSHPYHWVSGEIISWFAHNGSAKKKILAEKLHTNPWMKTDSELLGQFIVSNITNCLSTGEDIDKCTVEIFNQSKDYIEPNSALNTVLLILWSNTPRLYVSHWVNTQNPLLERYYSIYSYIGEGLVFTGSITIQEYLPSPYREKLSKLEYGVYRLKSGEIIKLSSL